MRLTEPRIVPLPVEQWAEEIAPLADRMRDGPLGRVVNLFKTLAHHPRALKRYVTFAHHVVRSSLCDRDREILVLRTAQLCQADYEWAHHVVIAKSVGLTDAEIARIKSAAIGADLADNEQLLLRAADELHTDTFISDATWSALLRFYDTAQMVDIVLTVGNYTMLGMVLNSLGVPLDEGLNGSNGG